MKAARFLLVALALGAACTDYPSAPEPPKAARITLTPQDIGPVNVASQFFIHASILDEKGVSLVRAGAAFECDRPDVVRVTPAAGNATSVNNAYVVALKPGTAVITARYQTVSGTMTVVVREPGPVAVIDMGPRVSTMTLGGSEKLLVTTRDSTGYSLAPTVTFTSSDPEKVSVSDAGFMLAVGEGTAVITASAGGMSVSRTVTVLAAAHAFRWTAGEGLVDLGVLPGYQSSWALAVSANGLIAGYVRNEFTQMTSAFAWSAANGMRELAAPADAISTVATGINSAGQVVGYAVTTGGGMRAVLWEPDDTLRELAVSAMGGASRANAINDAGQVVGMVAQFGPRPFIWDAVAGMRELAGVNQGSANAINAAGVVVGQYLQQPFRWRSAVGVERLPLLPGDAIGTALAISNAGDVAGMSTTCRYGYDYDYYDYYCEAEYYDHPARWDTARAVAGFATEPDARMRFAQLQGVNSLQQYVGLSGTTGHAFVWSPKGYTDLGTLAGRTKSMATAINDAGVVVGGSYN